MRKYLPFVIFLSNPLFFISNSDSGVSFQSSLNSNLFPIWFEDGSWLLPKCRNYSKLSQSLGVDTTEANGRGFNPLDWRAVFFWHLNSEAFNFFAQAKMGLHQFEKPSALSIGALYFKVNCFSWHKSRRFPIRFNFNGGIRSDFLLHDGRPWCGAGNPWISCFSTYSGQFGLELEIAKVGLYFVNESKENKQEFFSSGFEMLVLSRDYLRISLLRGLTFFPPCHKNDGNTKFPENDLFFRVFAVQPSLKRFLLIKSFYRFLWKKDSEGWSKFFFARKKIN